MSDFANIKFNEALFKKNLPEDLVYDPDFMELSEPIYKYFPVHSNEYKVYKLLNDMKYKPTNNEFVRSVLEKSLTKYDGKFTERQGEILVRILQKYHDQYDLIHQASKHPDFNDNDFLQRQVKWYIVQCKPLGEKQEKALREYLHQ